MQLTVTGQYKSTALLGSGRNCRNVKHVSRCALQYAQESAQGSLRGLTEICPARKATTPMSCVVQAYCVIGDSSSAKKSHVPVHLVHIREIQGSLLGPEADHPF
jgi:hypothetical protein